MSKLYTYFGLTSATRPRTITLPDGRVHRFARPADETAGDAAFLAFDKSFTLVEPPDPVPVPPAIPEPIQLLASQILALWATTKLPPPADWTAARQALRPWVAADPANRNTTLLELLSLRLELSELGGTWAQVLHLAAP